MRIEFKPGPGLVRVTYRYVNPSSAGPFRGSCYVEAGSVRRGDQIAAMMGRAVVLTVGRQIKESGVAQ